MSKYRNIMMTIIAISLIGINIQLFYKNLINPAHAYNDHNHSSWEIFGVAEEYHTHYEYADLYHSHNDSHSHSSWDFLNFDYDVRRIVENCSVTGYGYISC